MQVGAQARSCTSSDPLPPSLSIEQRVHRAGRLQRQPVPAHPAMGQQQHHLTLSRDAPLLQPPHLLDGAVRGGGCGEQQGIGPGHQRHHPYMGGSDVAAVLRQLAKQFADRCGVWTGCGVQYQSSSLSQLLAGRIGGQGSGCGLGVGCRISHRACLNCSLADWRARVGVWTGCGMQDQSSSSSQLLAGRIGGQGSGCGLGVGCSISHRACPNCSLAGLEGKGRGVDWVWAGHG